MFFVTTLMNIKVFSLCCCIQREGAKFVFKIELFDCVWGILGIEDHILFIVHPDAVCMKGYNR